jgi:hypothetical protein
MGRGGIARTLIRIFNDRKSITGSGDAPCRATRPWRGIRRDGGFQPRGNRREETVMTTTKLRAALIGCLAASFIVFAASPVLGACTGEELGVGTRIEASNLETV